MLDGRAKEWLEAGSFFEWAPREPMRGTSTLRVFHAERGDPEAPLLLLLHGFPTSSVDYYDVVDALSREHRVCLLDFPGFGFSDKPKGESYTLRRDCELVEHYLSEVVGAQAGAVVAHDRGDSVALTLAARCAAAEAHFELRHLVLSNGNMFLRPLEPDRVPAADPRSRLRSSGHGPGDPGAARLRHGRADLHPAAPSGRPGHRSPRADLRLQRWRRCPPRHDPIPGRALPQRAGVARGAGALAGPDRPSSGRSTMSSRRCGWPPTSGTPTWPASRATTSSGSFPAPTTTSRKTSRRSSPRS